MRTSLRPHADPLPRKSNYLIGNDPSNWRRASATICAGAISRRLPGNQSGCYGNQGRLEYDFQVAPGADPAQAELEFNGAKKLEVEDGASVIRSDADSIRLEAPQVYQEIPARSRRWKAASFCAERSTSAFAVGCLRSLSRADHRSNLEFLDVLSAAVATNSRLQLRSMEV